MIVTLTDFSNSEYVGVMKGVIYSIEENAQISDLFNDCNTIKEAAWILLQNYKYFPKNSIFLCVVDPGVGSIRKPLVIQTKNYYFIGPDNGLMYPAAVQDKIIKVTEIETQKGISDTFHGRDVFAPAAAKIEMGLQIKGNKIKNIQKLEFYLKGRTGEIVRLDKFGNIITNLPSLDKKVYDVSSGYFNQKLKFFKTYYDAPENELFLIKGSSNTLEISMKNLPANLKISIGDKITIK